MTTTLSTVLTEILATFVSHLISALPRLLSGLVFLTLAYLVIRLVRRYLRAALRRVYPTDQQLIADFGVLIVTIFLWFGVGLAFLRVVGLGDIAASLGTAAGFVALGVSYALSNMIADAVAGVYLLRDPDFNPGDHVLTESTAGVVKEIGIRKSRIDVEGGDTVVLANRDVEKKWTRKAPAANEA